MADSKSAPLSADGEIVGSFFCMYCGELNPLGVLSCHGCGQYIADQGPDLSARLHRIRRHARSVQAQHKAPQPRLMEHHASTADRAEAQVSARVDQSHEHAIADEDPDLSERLERIHRYARNVQTPPEWSQTSMSQSPVKVLDPVARHISPTPWHGSAVSSAMAGWLTVFVIIGYPLVLIAA